MSSFTIYNDQSINNLNANAINAASLHVAGPMTVSGDLIVTGSISPGTFTNRVVAIADLVAVGDHLLTAAQSGTTFLVNDITVGAQTVTLPVAAVGLNYKFIFQQVLAQNLVFTCSAVSNAETMVGYTNMSTDGTITHVAATTLTAVVARVLQSDTVTLEAIFDSRVGVCWQVVGFALTSATYT